MEIKLKPAPPTVILLKVVAFPEMVPPEVKLIVLVEVGVKVPELLKVPPLAMVKVLAEPSEPVKVTPELIVAEFTVAGVFKVRLLAITTSALVGGTPAAQEAAFDQVVAPLTVV